LARAARGLQAARSLHSGTSRRASVSPFFFQPPRHSGSARARLGASRGDALLRRVESSRRTSARHQPTILRLRATGRGQQPPEAKRAFKDPRRLARGRATCKGRDLPSWHGSTRGSAGMMRPSPAMPQHSTRSSSSSAHTWLWPTAISRARWTRSTGTGSGLSFVVPSPSCPCSFLPQHRTV
jgi:hypothetical protein